MQVVHPAQDHYVVPFLLTSFAILVGVGVESIGVEALFYYAITLPVPLFMLWLSRNEPGPQQGFEPADPPPVSSKPPAAMMQRQV